MAIKMILMKHPNVKADPKRASQDAFDKVWSKKGWTEHKVPSSKSDTTKIDDKVVK